MTTREDEYLEQRLSNQINWYDRKSAAAQASYKRLRLFEIIAAATIPFLAGLTDRHPAITVVVGALGVLVAVLAGMMGLFRFQETWTEYRAVAETLRQEKYLYLAGTGPYHDDEERFERLVERTEAILSSETSGWATAMRAGVKHDAAARAKAAS